MSSTSHTLPAINLPPVPSQTLTGLKKPNKSPTSVSGLEVEMLNDLKEPDSKNLEERRRRETSVSPTTKYKQSNMFRSQSPTDNKNRVLTSPNFVLRKKYMTSFHEEVTEPSTSL